MVPYNSSTWPFIECNVLIMVNTYSDLVMIGCIFGEIWAIGSFNKSLNIPIPPRWKYCYLRMLMRTHQARIVAKFHEWCPMRCRNMAKNLHIWKWASLLAFPEYGTVHIVYLVWTVIKLLKDLVQQKRLYHYLLIYLKWPSRNHIDIISVTIH